MNKKNTNTINWKKRAENKFIKQCKKDIQTFEYMGKKKRGGARKGAGRKPIKDKKIPLVIYIRPSIIKAHGGEENCRALLYGSLGITDF